MRTRDWRNLLLYIGAFFLAWTIRATILFPIDGRIAPPELRRVYADTVRILLWVVPVLLYLHLADRQRPSVALRLSTPIDRRGLLEGALVMLPIAAGLVAYCVLTNSSPHINVAQIVRHWFENLLALTIVPLAEEILFRGFILRHLTDLLRPLWANIVTSFLFVAIHWPNWLFTRGLQPGLLLDSAQILLLSMLLGYLVRRTNSLWPSIGVHLVNNLLATAFTFS